MTARRQQTRGAQTQQAIIEAALAVVDERGHRDLDIQGVCARAGASVGSFYHHLGSLEGLHAAVFDAILADYRRAIGAALQPRRSPRTFVEALVRTHVEWVCEHPRRARALYELRGGLEPAHDAEVRSGTRAFLVQIEESVARWRDRIRPLPAVLLQPLVIGPAETLTRQWLAGRLPEGFDPRDVADELARAAWRAVGLEP